MADRYVKLDDVISIIKDVNWNLGGLIQHLKEHCPTADVVPKSEVERLEAELAKAKEKAERMQRNLEGVLEERAEYPTEIAREIFAEIESEIEKFVQDARNCQEEYQSPAAKPFIALCEGKLTGLREAKQVITELKKKYTEGE